MKIRYTKDAAFAKAGDVTDVWDSYAKTLISQNMAVEYTGEAEMIKGGKEFAYLPSDNGISEVLTFIRNVTEEAYAQ